MLVVQCVYHDRHSKGPKMLSAEQRATDKAHEQLRAGRQARHGTLVCGVMRRALRFMGMYMYMGGWALLSGLYRLISGAALAWFFAMAALLLFSVLLSLERPPGPLPLPGSAVSGRGWGVRTVTQAGDRGPGATRRHHLDMTIGQ